MIAVTKTAIEILHAYITDIYIKDRVDSSPEFYRALIYETGIITNPEEIDGEEEYDEIVFELERILL